MVLKIRRGMGRYSSVPINDRHGLLLESLRLFTSLLTARLRFFPPLFFFPLDDNDDDQVPEARRGKIIPSMFPPPKENRSSMLLDRCLRLFPHDQDTGGFFVAVLEKKGQESEASTGRFCKFRLSL